MREGKKHGDRLIISIFVNPTQFGPGEDFAAYPRSLEQDLQLAETAGVDIVFTPEKQDLYPEGFETYITQETLPRHLCGVSRPTHFRGVLTVVAKLFHIVSPHVAVFGEKDYQQLAIIRRMVKDLNFDLEIIGCPTVREPDGLAMSSRNARLTPDQRHFALSLFNALTEAKQLLANGETDADRLIEPMSKMIAAHPENKIDYIRVCDPETLNDVDVINGPVLIALAVKVGEVRLIDNLQWIPKFEKQ